MKLEADDGCSEKGSGDATTSHDLLLEAHLAETDKEWTAFGDQITVIVDASNKDYAIECAHDSQPDTLYPHVLDMRAIFEHYDYEDWYARVTKLSAKGSVKPGATNVLRVRSLLARKATSWRRGIEALRACTRVRSARTGAYYASPRSTIGSGCCR